jgi:hypothetical protein
MKKTKNFILLIFTTLSVFSATAQSIDTLFVTMPDELFPLLKDRQRLELVEYYKAGQNDTIYNLFEGKTFLMAFIDGYIRLQSSESTTFEMFFVEDLQVNETFVGIIRTACAPVCNSVVNFYDKKWNAVSYPFPQLAAADWIDKTALAKTNYTFEEIANLFSIDFIEYMYNAENKTIEAINHSVEYLDEQEQKKLAPLISSNRKLIDNKE